MQLTRKYLHTAHAQATKCEVCEAFTYHEPSTHLVPGVRCKNCESHYRATRLSPKCVKCDPGQHRPADVGVDVLKSKGLPADGSRCLDCVAGTYSEGKNGMSVYKILNLSQKARTHLHLNCVPDYNIRFALLKMSEHE